MSFSLHHMADSPDTVSIFQDTSFFFAASNVPYTQAETDSFSRKPFGNSQIKGCLVNWIRFQGLEHTEELLQGNPKAQLFAVSSQLTGLVGWQKTATFILSFLRTGVRKSKGHWKKLLSNGSLLPGRPFWLTFSSAKSYHVMLRCCENVIPPPIPLFYKTTWWLNHWTYKDY